MEQVGQYNLLFKQDVFESERDTVSNYFWTLDINQQTITFRMTKQ